jgi:hypothetical protein
VTNALCSPDLHESIDESSILAGPRGFLLGFFESMGI